MSLDRPTLAEFVRHAERHGSELVYETAAKGYLEPEELGLLSLALQQLDRRWRLDAAQKTKLALALCERKLPLKRICEMSQLHRVTVYRLRQQHEQEAGLVKVGVDSAQPCGGNVAEKATVASDTNRPELQHAAP